MGFPEAAVQSRLPRGDMDVVLCAVPLSPMISAGEFELISKYYLEHAPDSIVVPEQEVERLTGFDPIDLPAFRGDPITSLKYDGLNGNLFIGLRTGKLYKLGEEFEIIDSAQVRSAISDIKVVADEVLVSAMGMMEPSEQAKGEVVKVNLASDRIHFIVDSLQRPVYFERSDLNGDAIDDFVICNFGNYTGNLLILQGLQNGTYQKHYLNRMAGARKVVIHDFNGDGLPDILVLMAQGDERVVIYYNEGQLTFREETLIRFPPVYGLSDMEVIDFNGDGFVDIVTTNGDNADYSVLHKPYHGVRLFENDKTNSFHEVWSFPMPGASQCRAVDFDNDGDLDIAAISFFPKKGRRSGGSFLLFENLGNYKFTARSLDAADRARWLVMETGDFDHDSDVDILLGAFNHNGLGGKALNLPDYSSKQSPSLLILENKK